MSDILKTARVVRQDMSLPILKRLVSLGYNRAIFNLNEQTHTVFDVCNHLDGESVDLLKLISNLEHDSPIFELTHVQCNCRLTCYSTENSELDTIVVDSYGGFVEPTKMDRNDKKDRQRVFYEKYNEYRSKFEEILNNQYITGVYSEPMNGIYSFDFQLYTTDENNYYYQQPSHMQELTDRVLDIILTQAQRYKINVEDAKPSAMHYIVTTSSDMLNYDWSKTDFMDLEWKLTDRIKYLNELVYELNQLEQWLLNTNELINNLLLKIEQNQDDYKQNQQQQQQTNNQNQQQMNMNNQQQQNQINNNQYDINIDDKSNPFFNNNGENNENL